MLRRNGFENVSDRNSYSMRLAVSSLHVTGVGCDRNVLAGRYVLPPGESVLIYARCDRRTDGYQTDPLPLSAGRVKRISK